MNVYIIYTHPLTGSFNAAIRDRLIQGLREAGHEVELSDLYAEGFQPILTGSELEQLARGEIPPDILRYQEKIRRAEALVFIYPIWWFGQPAMLKGWLDRVLSKGFAYDMTPNGPMPRLKIKKALILNTAGGMEPMYQGLGFTEAMKKVMDNGTLNFCGIPRVSHLIFHNVLNADDATRKGYLDEVYRLGREF
ncbi:MAG: hypothetical protein A2V67_01930 [Deltaproteobacteria bacterium RBG_13_61_14]|nr:MAG: hypothetical protein A2V67_01930 [Deltaproteobacteria bacterium RBG_13_61_14]